MKVAQIPEGIIQGFRSFFDQPFKVQFIRRIFDNQPAVFPKLVLSPHPSVGIDGFQQEVRSALFIRSTARSVSFIARSAKITP